MLVILPLYSPLTLICLFTILELQPKVHREEQDFWGRLFLQNEEYLEVELIPDIEPFTRGRMWLLPHVSMLGSCSTRWDS